MSNKLIKLISVIAFAVLASQPIAWCQAPQPVKCLASAHLRAQALSERAPKETPQQRLERIKKISLEGFHNRLSPEQQDRELIFLDETRETIMELSESAEKELDRLYSTNLLYRMIDTYLHGEQWTAAQRIMQFYRTPKRFEHDLKRAENIGLALTEAGAPRITVVYGISYPFYGKVDVSKVIFFILLRLARHQMSEQAFVRRIVPDIDLIIVYEPIDPLRAQPTYIRPGMASDMLGGFIDETTRFRREWNDLFEDLFAQENVASASEKGRDPAEEFLKYNRIHLDLLPCHQYVWNFIPLFVEPGDTKYFEWSTELFFTKQPLASNYLTARLDDMGVLFCRNSLLNILDNPMTHKEMLDRILFIHGSRHPARLFSQIRELAERRLNEVEFKAWDDKLIERDSAGRLRRTELGTAFIQRVLSWRRHLLDKGIFDPEYRYNERRLMREAREMLRAKEKKAQEILDRQILRARAAVEANRGSLAVTEEERQLAKFIEGIKGRTPKADGLYDILTRFYQYPLNNLGEVDDETYVRNNTKAQERELLDFWARHFKIPEGYGGHVTIGRQQAELYAMLVARSRFPQKAVFYVSNEVDDILYCSLQVLGVPENRIRLIKSGPDGEIDYADLEEKVKESNGSPAVVCLNAGRLLGGIDDLGRVKGILGRAGVKQKHIHYSMAPVGIGESFLNEAFKKDFRHNVDSMTLPIDRFSGSPIPGTITLTKRAYVKNISRGQGRVEYVNVEDTTIPGSRSGHAPLYLWLATRVMGAEGFKARANRGREVCRYVKKVLDLRGYPCRFSESGDTIVFKQPSDEVRRKWGLLSYKQESCFEAIPYLTKIEIAELINDLLKDNFAAPGQAQLISPAEVEVSEAPAYMPSKKVLANLDALERHMKKFMGEFLGFPANVANSAESYQALRGLFKYILKKQDADSFGRMALDFFAKLYGVKNEDVFSGVTAGGTWGNLIGILAGRERFPSGILYYSEDSHYSIDKVARVLGMEVRRVRSLPNGEIDYDALEKEICAHRDRPVILNLNIGTTMKGAIDNPQNVIDVLKRNNIDNYHIHCDAALSGMLVPFLEGTPQIDLVNDVHSLAISGHKFMGLPMPSGVFMVRKNSISPNLMRTVDELLTVKTGYVLFYLWHAVMQRGYDGFKREAILCVQNAQYLRRRLNEIGYPSRLNAASNIVLFARPSDKLIDKWQLAPYGDFAHIVVMQHVTKEKIDRFIEDLKQDMQTCQRAYPRLTRQISEAI